MKLTVCILAILAMTAFASDPRLNVLARGDARLLVDDYNEMWAYPGTIGDYQFAQISSVSAIEGGWDLGWFGGVKQMGNATWGGTHNHNGYLLEALYHGGNFGVIVGLDYSSNIVVAPDTIDEFDFGLAFGTEINLFSKETDLAIGLAYNSTTTTVDTVDTKDSFFAGGISLRGDNEDALVNLFPIMSVGFISTSEESSPEDETIIAVDFGGGINKMFTPSTRFIAGIFIGLENTSFSVDSGDAPDSRMDIDIMDISFGAEQQLFNWLYLRGGADMVTDYVKQGDADAVISTSYSDSYGIGFDIGNFALDAEISDVFLHDGPYLVSGNSNGFMSNLSCSYYF